MARLPNQNLKAGLVEKSERLSERASLEWDRLITELDKAGVKLTAAHRALLTLAATTAADIRRDWEEVVRTGAYTLDAKGQLQAHPAVGRVDRLRRDYIKLLSLLGLRSAVSAGEAPAKSLDDVLNG